MTRDGVDVSRFVRFLAVGLTNAIVSYTVYLALITVAPPVRFRVLLAQLASYGAGIAWSFVWNRRWTFASRGQVGAEAVRFVVSQLAFMVGSAVALQLLVERQHLDSRVAWLAVMGPVTVLNYFVLRSWVFARAKRSATTA